MKIREFAEGKGLTKQAVYKALNRAGFSAKDLTDRSGNLSKKGLATLRKLFPDDQDQPELQQERPERPDQAAAQEQDQEKELLRSRIKTLEDEVSDWKKRYFDLVDSSNNEREQLRILIDQEQRLRAAAENRGFLRRLFSGKKEKEGSGSTMS